MIQILLTELKLNKKALEHSESEENQLRSEGEFIFVKALFTISVSSN